MQLLFLLDTEHETLNWPVRVVEAVPELWNNLQHIFDNFPMQDGLLNDLGKAQSTYLPV